MAGGTQAFRATVGAWAAKLSEANLAGLARAAIQDLCEGVLDDTRVDTGFLVGSWQPNIGDPLMKAGPAVGGEHHVDHDAAEAVAQPKIALTLIELKLGNVFYYTNNTAYAMRIEYGFVGQDSLGRYYNQAGHYMVTKNVAKWQNYVDNAAKRLGYVK
jgi:hypothetical protein